jgi:hypothetical protein
MLVLSVVLVYLYFLPSIVAKRNRKANYRAIRTLNLLAGWTFIGWVVAMVWATAKDDKREIPQTAPNPETEELARQFAEFLKSRKQS